ncbi:unnamed protein product [Malus baccata var. baccata]
MTNISMSPFTNEIERTDPPRRFTMHHFTPYKENEDPNRHLKHYYSTMILYRNNDALICKIFATTLQGEVQDCSTTAVDPEFQRHPYGSTLQCEKGKLSSVRKPHILKDRMLEDQLGSAILSKIKEKEICIHTAYNRFGRLSTTTVPSSAAGGIDEPLLPPFDYEPQPYNGPLADQVFQKRNKFLGPSLSIIIRILSILLKEDAIFVRREWQAVVYFVNSWIEANELAMLMACLYSGSLDMISLRNAYHGGSSNTIGLTALNTWKYPIPQIFGSDANSYAKDVQDHIDYGTSGKVAGFISETIQGVGGAVELAPGYLKLVYDIVCKAGGVCIADEVQTGFGRTGSHYWGFETQDVIPDIVTMAKGIGNGLSLGALVTTPEIASVLAQKILLMHKTGGVLEQRGLAVLRVIDKEKRQVHCAYVGSHLLGRIRRGLALLRVIDKEKRQVHCADVGSHLLGRIRDLQERYENACGLGVCGYVYLRFCCWLHMVGFLYVRSKGPYYKGNDWHEINLIIVGIVIGDVGGRGLMVGIELVYDRNEKIPAKAETASLFEKLREFTLLGWNTYFDYNCMPADFLVDALDYYMSKL